MKTRTMRTQASSSSMRIGYIRSSPLLYKGGIKQTYAIASTSSGAHAALLARVKRATSARR